MEDNLWRQKAVERRAELKEPGKRRKELNSSLEKTGKTNISLKNNEPIYLKRNLLPLKKN